MKWHWILVGSALLVAGRGLAAEADLERLDAARERWQAVQAGDYVYGFQRYCECYAGEPPLTVVTVTGGRIVSIYFLHDYSDREVPASDDDLDYYWTIDELFDKLAQAFARDAVVRVEYHPALGYPTSLFVDYDPDFIGDETDIELSRFETL